MLCNTALQQRLEAGASMAMVTDSIGMFVTGLCGIFVTGWSRMLVTCLGGMLHRGGWRGGFSEAKLSVFKAFCCSFSSKNARR